MGVSTSTLDSPDKATVKIVCRDLQGSFGAMSDAARNANVPEMFESLNLPNNLVIDPSILLQHWAVVVEYPDDDGAVWLCEGTTTELGEPITPTCEELSKAELRAKLGRSMSVYFMGHTDATRSELRSFCRRHELNGEPMDLLANNCQSWAIKLCTKLGMNLLQLVTMRAGALLRPCEL